MSEETKKKFWQRRSKPDEALDALTVDEDRKLVIKELEQTKEFVSELTGDDFKEGKWFEKLLFTALANYATKVDAEFFRNKYPDLPFDAIVDMRIQMAARYASIEGALSSFAYTGAVSATIGSLGGASPITLGASVVSFLTDMVYTTQLQLKTTYDISVLYGVPLNIDDPDDMWKLVKIALGIKAGEASTIAITKSAPEIVRKLLKTYYSRSVLAAARGLPAVGKYLLQRNVIKFAIPIVGVPATTAANYWTTKFSGIHAKKLLRHEVKIAEAANKIAADTTDLGAILWLVMLIMKSDAALNEDESLFYHYVSKAVRNTGNFKEELNEIQSSLAMDDAKAWSKIADSKEPGETLYQAGLVAAAVDGKVTVEKLETLKELAVLLNVTFSEKDAIAYIKHWAKE